MYLRLLLLCVLCLCASLISCGQHTTTPALNGRVDIFVFLHQPGESSLSKTMTQASGKAVSGENLIVEISASDLDTIRDTISLSESSVNATMNIPAGEDRKIAAWTENSAGQMVHGREEYLTDIRPAQTTSAVFELYPVVGSIYIQLARVPTDVSVLFALFNWQQDSVLVQEQRAGLTFLTLDYIPDGAEGELYIWAEDENGAVQYADTVPIHFRATANSTYQADFSTSPGNVDLQLSMHHPGITLVTGALEVSSPGEERGPLMITEIMYAADGDSDYIEIWNSADTTFNEDTLIVEILGTSSSTSKHITIYDFSVGPGEFYLISQCGSEFPFADTCISSMSLPKSGGRLIVLRCANNDIIDYVSYAVNEHGWPKNSDLTAIVYAFNEHNPESNNYGSLWQHAESPITASSHLGTPKALGR